MAKYYVAAGAASTNVGAATNSATPCNLNAAWDDMAAGTTIATGDTIELAPGLYNNTTTDVPVAGLGDSAADISLIIQTSADTPDNCIIDFSGTNADVDGFRVTTTGTFEYKGMTIKGADPNAGEGQISMIDGTLELWDCIVEGRSLTAGAGSLIQLTSTAAAGKVYAYNCEFSNGPTDGIDCGGAGGALADRGIFVYNCYFHDIGTGIDSANQAITPHNGATIEVGHCKFERCGRPDKGGAIGSDANESNGVIFNNEFYGVLTAVGLRGDTVVVKNNYFQDIILNVVINTLAAGGTITFENNTVINPAAGAYLLFCNNVAMDINILGNYVHAVNSWGDAMIFGATTGDRASTLTMEDNQIISLSPAAKYMIRNASQNVVLNRNVIYTNAAATSNGVIRNDNATTAVVLTMNDNKIRWNSTDRFISAATGVPAAYTGGNNMKNVDVGYWGYGTDYPIKGDDTLDENISLKSINGLVWTELYRGKNSWW